MNLSIIQRFLADTPPFFKRVHAFGLVLCGLAVAMAQYPIPSKFTIIVGTAGAVLAVVSQFAVNIVPTIENPSLASIPGALNDLNSTVNEVASLVKNHPTAADLAKIVADAIPPVAPAVEQNIVIADAPAAEPDKPADNANLPT